MSEPVPQRAILLLERQQFARRTEPRTPPRVLHQHQRQQPARLGLERHEVDDGLGERDRRVGHVGEGDVAVARVERQVQHGEHPVQPLLQQLGRRNPVRDAGVLDLAARPHQPLRHRGLRHEERPRDLGDRETGDRAQRQCNPGGERQAPGGST